MFSVQGWHIIDIDIVGHSLNVEVDGKNMLTTSKPCRLLKSWDTDYRLALGNEFTGNRSWLGDIRRAVVTVDGERYDYLAVSELLHIPQVFDVESKRVFRFVPFVSNAHNGAGAKDQIINLLGFVPFGWLVWMFRRQLSGVYFAAICSALLSFMIEAGQFFIPVRIPSTEDFILNVLGG